jgi:ER membrane protein complex subunit 3
MLQRGIETADMDVTWVSSLSWYFLNLFGLRGIFDLILGEGNSADGMKDMQSMAVPQQQQAAAMGQPQDMQKIFMTEKEHLDLTVHEWDLASVETRLLAKVIGVPSANEKKSQ